MYLEFPNGCVSINSPLYIPRPPIEEITYQEITKPGSVIRIKAPRRTGKSSLLARIIAYANEQGYKTVNIDLQQADQTVFTSLEKFLRWLCANISLQLELKPMLDDYWDEDIGSKVSCSIYLKMHILKPLKTPLVLALNEVNRIFEYPQIAQDFFSLLRSWHEEAKQNQILQKLRLIVVHSTEIYISLNINQSPFNVGLPIKLSEFTLEQVKDLAQRHQLNWTEKEAQQLMAMVGGHPYLVRIALYYLSQDTITFEELLETAPSLTGIYADILREQLANIMKYPELLAGFKEVIMADSSIQLKPIIAYQLESMGLVKINGNNCTVSCELYRLYFATQNLAENTDLSEMVNDLQKTNEDLYRLCYLDELTQLGNRRQIDQKLKEEWQRLARKKEPLSIIYCDLDYFKFYNQEYGNQSGDDCLRKIAQTIKNIVTDSKNLVGRYGGEEFMIIMPNTKTDYAVKIAEEIRQKVKELAITHNSAKIGGLPASVITISLGVACTIPQLEKSVSSLVNEAEKALYQAKREGRDRVFVQQSAIT